MFAANAGEIAAVLVEPIAANMGFVPPGPGYLDGLRAQCNANGALLVFDEVITGFRVGPAGMQGIAGIAPDLSIFGKVVGGGLPLAAVGGRADVMDQLAPVGPVYQAGTLSGNPLATAAGLAALALLDDAAYTALEAKATHLADGLRDAIRQTVPRRSRKRTRSSACSSSPSPVTNYDEAKAADHERYARCFHGLLDRGVYFAPSGYETLFPSLAHTDDDIERTIKAAAEA